MEVVNARLLVAKNSLAAALEDKTRIALSSLHGRSMRAAINQFVGAWSFDDVIKLTDEVQGVKFEPKDAADLIGLLSQHSCTHAQKGGARNKPVQQDYTTVLDFFTQLEWDDLKQMNVITGVDFVAKRVCDLGGRCLTEDCKKLLTCVIIAAVEGRGLNAGSKRTIRATLTKKIKSKTRNHRDMDERWFKQLPTPSVLKEEHAELYNSVFQHNDPIRCPLPINALCHDASSMPTRYRSSSADMSPLHEDCGLQVNGGPIAQLGMFMVKQMQEMQAGQQKMFEVMMGAHANVKNEPIGEAALLDIDIRNPFIGTRKALISPPFESPSSTLRRCTTVHEDMGGAAENLKSEKERRHEMIAEAKRRMMEEDEFCTPPNKIRRMEDNNASSLYRKDRPPVGDVILDLIGKREAAKKLLKDAKDEAAANDAEPSDIRTTLLTCDAIVKKDAPKDSEPSDIRIALPTCDPIVKKDKAGKKKGDSAHIRSALVREEKSADGVEIVMKKALIFSHEKSRSQIMLRTGLQGPGQSFPLKYGKGQRFKDEEVAISAAKKWKAMGVYNFDSFK